MKRWGWLVAVVCVVSLACDDNPAAPSNAPLVFAAQLSPANEVPPIGNAESVARGAVQITLNATRDSSGAITAATADFHIQIAGLPENTVFVGAHIHPGAAGVNGPVTVNTSLSSGTQPAIASGAATWNFRNVNVAAATAQAIASNPAGFYFNVHTFSNPGGVARGQLARVQ
jgi:hypothetical protein